MDRLAREMMPYGFGFYVIGRYQDMSDLVHSIATAVLFGLTAVFLIWFYFKLFDGG